MTLLEGCHVAKKWNKANTHEKRYELQNEELESFIIIPIKKGIILLSHG